MQPYYEAKTLGPKQLGDKTIPPLVTQIADGENGGVMMNEFPSAFKRAWHEMGGSRQGTVAFNGTEYLELLADAGVEIDDFPSCQAVGQAKLWERVEGEVTPEKVRSAIAQLKDSPDGVDMSGGSWTNDRSWVEGYSDVLTPMENLSKQFHQKLAATGEPVEALRQTATLSQRTSYTICCYRRAVFAIGGRVVGQTTPKRSTAEDWLF